MSTNQNEKRVLAIDVASRGFGYAVLEGPDRLIDWGVKETKADKNRRALKLIKGLINDYEPDVIVVEDYAGKGARRSPRVRALINSVLKLKSNRKVKVRSVTKREMRRTFSDYRAATKYEIALAIAKRFPELAPRLPRVRKPWMSEDYRMSIFDAVSLAVAYFHFKERKKMAA